MMFECDTNIIKVASHYPMCVLVKGRGFNSHSVQYLLFLRFFFVRIKVVVYINTSSNNLLKAMLESLIVKCVFLCYYMLNKS